MALGDKQPMENTTESSDPPRVKEGLFANLKSFFFTVPQDNEVFAPISPISKGKFSPIIDQEVDKFIASETGLDRLKHMYSYDPLTIFSADLYGVLSMATPVTLVSGVIIAGLRYPRAKEDFMKSPERGLVKFQRSNLRMARRYKYDIIALDVMKTSVRAAVKFGGFFTCILLVNQNLATYNNKSSPLYYAAGGAVAGAINKFFYGVRAMAAAGSIAGVMGLLYGGAFYLFLRQYDMTQDKFHWEDVKRRLEIGYETTKKSDEKGSNGPGS
ncbi:uncharacterized protein LOC125655705 isoform X2 [Ostrea edulis]|uniref:uncharacterized protein LOC125655705 isoform X2 n=1 Tax=Ostrea edulis TaxID=37623 RepID=UPI0020965450|nr:uncharacterized protein LOC125655705 isoform X2 [Ostrea edulis]